MLNIDACRGRWGKVQVCDGGQLATSNLGGDSVPPPSQTGKVRKGDAQREGKRKEQKKGLRERVEMGSPRVPEVGWTQKNAADLKEERREGGQGGEIGRGGEETWMRRRVPEVKEESGKIGLDLGVCERHIRFDRGWGQS